MYMKASKRAERLMASWIYPPSLPLEEAVGDRSIPSITTGAPGGVDGSTPFLPVAYYKDSSLIGRPRPRRTIRVGNHHPSSLPARWEGKGGDGRRGVVKP